MKRIRGASVKALRRVQAEGPLHQAGRYLAEELVATTGFVDCPVVSPEEYASRLARLIEDVAQMRVDVPPEVLVSARDPKGRKHSRVLARAMVRAGYPADGPVHQAIMREFSAVHATLQLAYEIVWDLAAFDALGHIPGVDEGRSCYRVCGAFERAPAVLASGIGGLFDAFVIVMRRAEDGPSGDVVGRCWGLVNHAGAMVSNAYWGAKVQHGAGIRPFQLALHQALLGDPAPDKLGFWQPVDYGFQAGLKRAHVYCNGDAVGVVFHESPDTPFGGLWVETDFLDRLFPPERVRRFGRPAAQGSLRAANISLYKELLARLDADAPSIPYHHSPIPLGAVVEAYPVHDIVRRMIVEMWQAYSTLCDIAVNLRLTGGCPDEVALLRSQMFEAHRMWTRMSEEPPTGDTVLLMFRHTASRWMLRWVDGAEELHAAAMAAQEEWEKPVALVVYDEELPF